MLDVPLPWTRPGLSVAPAAHCEPMRPEDAIRDRPRPHICAAS
jgi:hypothetical protein